MPTALWSRRVAQALARVRRPAVPRRGLATQRCRRQRRGTARPAAWLSPAVLGAVLAAWLLGSLAPGISRLRQALGEPSPAAALWLQVCTAQGLAWLAPDGRLLPGPPAAAGPFRAEPPQAHAAEGPLLTPRAAHGAGLVHALDACGHCLLALERLTAPLPALPLPAVVALRLLPSAQPDGPSASLRATSASARGPPRLS